MPAGFMGIALGHGLSQGLAGWKAGTKEREDDERMAAEEAAYAEHLNGFLGQDIGKLRSAYDEIAVIKRPESKVTGLGADPANPDGPLVQTQRGIIPEPLIAPGTPGAPVAGGGAGLAGAPAPAANTGATAVTAHKMDAHITKTQELQEQLRLAMAKAPGKPGSKEYNRYATRVFKAYEKKIDKNLEEVKPMLEQAGLAKGTQILNESLRLVMGGKSNEAAELMEANGQDGTLFRGARLDGMDLVLAQADEDGVPMRVPIPTVLATNGTLTGKDAMSLWGQLYKTSDTNRSRERNTDKRVAGKLEGDKIRADSMIEGSKIRAGATVKAAGIDAGAKVTVARDNNSTKKDIAKGSLEGKTEQQQRSLVENAIRSVGSKNQQEKILAAQNAIDIILSASPAIQQEKAKALGVLRGIVSGGNPSGGIAPAPAAASAPKAQAAAPKPETVKEAKNKTKFTE